MFETDISVQITLIMQSFNLNMSPVRMGENMIMLNDSSDNVMSFNHFKCDFYIKCFKMRFGRIQKTHVSNIMPCKKQGIESFSKPPAENFM